MIKYIIIAIIVMAIIGAILEKVIDAAENVAAVIAGIIALVIAFFLLKYLLRVLHFLVCLVPVWFIYVFVLLYIVFVLVWSIICLINIYLDIVIECEVCLMSAVGSSTTIANQLKVSIKNNSTGISKIVLGFCMKIYSRLNIFHMRVGRKCIRLRSECCTKGAVYELLNLIENMGMGTDKEIIDEAQNCEDINKKLKTAIMDLGNFKICCTELCKEKELEIDSFGESTEGFGDDMCFEKKLYKAKHPNPQSDNMLPTVYLTVD